jgi:hypothetical protein
MNSRPICLPSNSSALWEPDAPGLRKNPCWRFGLQGLTHISHHRDTARPSRNPRQPHYPARPSRKKENHGSPRWARKRIGEESSRIFTVAEELLKINTLVPPAILLLMMGTLKVWLVWAGWFPWAGRKVMVVVRCSSMQLRTPSPKAAAL